MGATLVAMYGCTEGVAWGPPNKEYFVFFY